MEPMEDFLAYDPAPPAATFDALQMEMFNLYERVRSSGRYNMFELAAVSAGGLTMHEYIFVMDNYDAMAEQAAAGRQ